MTNKEREALEKIVNSNINEIPNKTDNDPYINMINYLKYIAKLALKTPQECDVTKCLHYKEYKHCELGKLYSWFNFDCRLNSSCNFKKWQRAEQQLHSQQKTFTMEEIKEIIENYYDENEKAVLPLLAEFEKGLQ